MRRRLKWLARHRRPIFAVVLTVAAGLALMAFILGRSDDDEELTGAAKEVVALVEDFERSVERRDFSRVCNVLFTREAREGAGGQNCAALLEQSNEGVKNIEITIESRAVKGEVVEARLRASADGIPAGVDGVEFARRDGRFQINAWLP